MKMRSLLLTVVAVVIAAASVWAANEATPAETKKELSPAELKTDADKDGYSLGVKDGMNLLPLLEEAEVNVDIYFQGIKDVLAKRELAMSLEEVKSQLKALQLKIRTKREEARNAAGEKNKVEGPAFLAENAKKEGVVVLDSGLQYKVLKEGTGAIPTKTDKVRVNYRGTFINGEEFDSSARRGEAPAEFAVTGVIPGWTEALLLMKEGAKWQLFVPAALAYGDRGWGPVAPNATLLFEIELMEVVK